MKKLKLGFLSLVVFSSILSSCGDNPSSLVSSSGSDASSSLISSSDSSDKGSDGLSSSSSISSGLKLSLTSKTIEKGDDFTLVASFEDQALTDVSWQSSDSAVATVLNGKVTGVESGNATITASYNDKKATCEVQVLSSSSIAKITAIGTNIEASGIIEAITEKGFILSDGVASIYVFTNGPVTYDEGSYVSVKGEVSLYNSALQFTGKQTALEITLLEGEGPAVQEPVELSSAISDSFSKKTSFTTKDIIKYSYRSSKAEQITSSGNTFYKLNVPGSSTVIEPNYPSSSLTIKPGTAYDVVGYIGGYNTKYKYCPLNIVSLVEVEEVIEPSADPESVKITSSKATLPANGSLRLTSKVLPDNASQKVEWSSSNTEAATISTGGVVQGVNIGTTTITCKAKGTEITDTLLVTVTEKVDTPMSDEAKDYYGSSVDFTATGETLKTQLYKKISPHTNVGYDGLYKVYLDSDLDENGKIWDMYSNQHYKPSDNNGNYNKEGDMYNREHTIPQSVFSKKAPMKTDAFHVVPTDGYVNSKRSNYPHAEVKTSRFTSSNNTLVGSSDTLGISGNVCEPAEEYKGDFARMYFYFVTCYQDKIPNYSFGSFAKNTYPSLSTWAKNLYLKWAEDDPVSTKEVNRNSAVFKYQKNRNPYIDYPGLERLVWNS